MAKIYLGQLQALLAPVAARPPAGVELEIKHFFGGAAAYAGGRIAITLTPAGLAMKLPEKDRAALKKAGARPLRYFAGAPIKKDYVILPRKLRDDKRSLRAWARKSIEYALTLPAGKKRGAAAGQRSARSSSSPTTPRRVAARASGSPS